MKILMLVGEKNSTFDVDDIDGIWIDKRNLYNNFKYMKIFRHLNRMTYFSLDSWKNKIKEYDLIFCIDSTVTLSVLKWINKNKREDTRQILYFRNKFLEKDKRWSLQDLKKIKMEIWSYNFHDCKKYEFAYNSQTLNYNNIVASCKRNTKIEYGLAFIGVNKSRVTDIEKIQQLLNKAGIKSFFYVLNAPYLKDNRCISNKYMEYEEYLDILNKSNAVLDLVSSENKGLTFRPIEAMFLKKKLVTNYKEIKEYPFYCKQNIWILGEDDENSFESFLESQYRDIPRDIMMEFDTKEWLKRFLV